MRILMWASTYGDVIGGGPVLAPLLAASLAERGHVVSVLTDLSQPTLPSREVRDGVTVHRLTFRGTDVDAAATMSVRRQVAGIKQSLRPDVSFIFSSSSGDLHFHTTRSVHPAPLVVALHDCFPAYLYEPGYMVGNNLGAASWVTACSAAAMTTLRNALPAVVPTSSVILNALPLPPAVKRNRSLHPRLAFLERLIEKKGVHMLLAAVERLAERFPNIRVSVAGEGEERPALEALARELGVATHVDFVGPLPHIAAVEFLAESDIVVVPSLIEPFGLVALEAAQAGRPVVASDVDGLPEVVVHGETGLLVPPNDPRALGDAIAALLLDRPRADALGAAGRRRAETAFRWDDYVDAYERLFRSLSAQSK